MLHTRCDCVLHFFRTFVLYWHITIQHHCIMEPQNIDLIILSEFTAPSEYDLINTWLVNTIYRSLFMSIDHIVIRLFPGPWAPRVQYWLYQSLVVCCETVHTLYCFFLENRSNIPHTDDYLYQRINCNVLKLNHIYSAQSRTYC